MENNKTALKGHESPETAYIVNDYPYGFRLRCKIRYWVETKTGKGQRFCSQTTNPKKEVEYWNKPKKSTYCLVIGMYLDTDGKVFYDSLGSYNHEEEKINSFMAIHTDLNEYQLKAIKFLRASNIAATVTTWTVNAASDD